jgi:isoleucyl-tRNA synthetase
VHLTDFPVADASKINDQLSASTQLAIKVCSLGRAARNGANIKVRQPLSKVVVAVKSHSEREGLMKLKPQVLEELNVKDIDFVDSMGELNQSNYTCMLEGDNGVALCTEISHELEMEGMAREIVHRLQTMRKSAGFEIADQIITFFEGDDYIQKVMQDNASVEYLKQETLSRDVVTAVPLEGVYSENFKLGSHPVKLGVKKA